MVKTANNSTFGSVFSICCLDLQFWTADIAGNSTKEKKKPCKC